MSDPAADTPVDPSTGEPPIPETPARHRSRQNAALLTAGVGIAFSVLFFAAMVLVTGVPLAAATDEEIREYYTSGSGSTAVTLGLYVLPFAGIAFIWFIVALRMWSSASTRVRSELQ